MVKTNRMQRALQIREAALAVLRRQGTMSEMRGLPGRLATATLGNLHMSFRTPFQRLPAETEEMKFFRERLTQRGHKANRNLGYGLDIWTAPGKVFNLEWSNDDQEVRLVSFKRGPWEEVVLGEA